MVVRTYVSLNLLKKVVHDLSSLGDNTGVLASSVSKKLGERYHHRFPRQFYAITCYDRKIMWPKLAEIEFVLYL